MLKNNKLIFFSTLIAFTIVALFAIYLNKGNGVADFKIDLSKEKEKAFTIKIDSLQEAIKIRNVHIQMLMQKLVEDDSITIDSLTALSIDEIGKLLRK